MTIKTYFITSPSITMPGFEAGEIVPSSWHILPEFCLSKGKNRNPLYHRNTKIFIKDIFCYLVADSILNGLYSLDIEAIHIPIAYSDGGTCLILRLLFATASSLPCYSHRCIRISPKLISCISVEMDTRDCTISIKSLLRI